MGTICTGYKKKPSRFCCDIVSGESVMLDIDITLSFECFVLCSSPCPAFFVVELTKWMGGLDVLIEKFILDESGRAP